MDVTVTGVLRVCAVCKRQCIYSSCMNHGYVLIPCHCPSLWPVLCHQVVSCVNILVELMSVLFSFVFYLLSPLFLLFVVVLCVCCCCWWWCWFCWCWCCPLSPTLLHANPPLPTSGQQHMTDVPLPFPHSIFIQFSDTLYRSLSPSLLLSISSSGTFLFLPPPCSPASNMQSWESTMPPPVSQRPSTGRAKGSAHKQGRGQGWYSGAART